MRLVLSLISFLLVIAAMAAAGAFIWGWQAYTAPGPLAESKVFTVERGQGVARIAELLLYDNIVEDPYLFRVTARLKGIDTGLKAGEYEFPAHVSMMDVLDKLARGAVYQRLITLREGLTSWQVVQILNANEDLSGEKITDIPPEGSLLPETYSYVSGDTRSDKIMQMQKAMDEVLEELWYERDKSIPLLSKAEVIIMASIVEKETGVAAERARIAGVFENRLRKSIALQTDPTVIYALTGGKIQDNGKGPLGRRLLRKDLAFESPYNTYKHPGLPPGPICNPGRDAIHAVLNPEKHNFLYFVADGTGGHAFAETLADHNRNVARWRKVRKQQGN